MTLVKLDVFHPGTLSDHQHGANHHRRRPGDRLQMISPGETDTAVSDTGIPSFPVASPASETAVIYWHRYHAGGDGWEYRWRSLGRCHSFTDQQPASASRRVRPPASGSVAAVDLQDWIFRARVQRTLCKVRPSDKLCGVVQYYVERRLLPTSMLFVGTSADRHFASRRRPGSSLLWHRLRSAWKL